MAQFEDKTLAPDVASKDRFFEEVAGIADRMIDAHGREFAMGALVLAARFIAENKRVDRPRDPG